MHVAFHAMQRNFAQALTAARAGHALATGKLEAGPMHRTYQQAVLAAQELAGRPIQAAASMRAYVQPRAHSACGIPMHDQRFCIAIKHGLDLMQAIQRNAFDAQQDIVRGVDFIVI